MKKLAEHGTMRIAFLLQKKMFLFAKKGLLPRKLFRQKVFPGFVGSWGPRAARPEPPALFLKTSRDVPWGPDLRGNLGLWGVLRGRNAKCEEILLFAKDKFAPRIISCEDTSGKFFLSAC